ncbi:iron ABC transporter permease [Gordonia sp. HY002]|uniref:FecCD family ABC transporter permease n=1 Tax=Gordonia zhenghanii TaxID=2911516 RepID=UPI001EF04756|nr:iron ABC transporter permease [Gordonia zhenghanii]MCF8568812.1 iron ABC transporter permease [Gordonia zhenghanii]MCF8602318.1 iron ABC transporter permease [Gordonia zhenghanii]
MGKTPRRLGGLLLLIAALAAVCVASIAFGSRTIPVGDVWHVLWNKDGTDVSGIVHGLRIPRTVLGLVAGAAIGAAGALTQGHTRNPMADPGILGVNAGAACTVVLGVYVIGITTPIEYMGFGLVGALIASSLMFLIASAGKGANPLTLILAGTGLSVLLMAITSAIVLVDTASLDAWRFWQVGSTQGRGWDVIVATLPFIVPGMVLAVMSGFYLNVLSLGDDVAHALGTRVRQARIIGIVGITLLVGAATAACGPIVFLGLVAPHIARFVTGPDYRWVVPYSALIGGLLLVGSDVIGRVIARPGEVQAGIILAAIGAPFFIGLVQAKKLVAV